MSTIFYEDEKFQKIRDTLLLEPTKYAHLWEYPDGWKEGAMDRIIEAFVQDLRLANVRAYNIRYDKHEPDRIVPGTKFEPYNNQCEFLKSLRGLRYNMDRININGCDERLKNLIYSVMCQIIDGMPEYKEADTW